MHPLHSLSRLVIAASCCAAGSTHATTLYQTFALPSTLDAWQSYAVPLAAALPGAPGVWRVAASDADIGSPTGALATDAQLQAVLGQLTALQIGGLVTNGSNGETIYPGNLGLDNPSLAGRASDNFDLDSFGWSVTVADGGWSGLGWFAEGGSPAGFVGAVQISASPALLSFVAPSAYLGNQSAAFGQTLSFDLKTFPSSSTNPMPSYGQGVVILTAVPEPAAWLLMMGGLAVAGVRRRE